MDKLPDTEKASKYERIEEMSTLDVLSNINREDATVADAVALAIPQIQRLVDAIVSRMQTGGRLFYIGSGTSGRLGVVDASECPPTFGVPHDLVVGIIAGGDGAIRKAVEFAEDDQKQAWEDLKAYFPDEKDTVIGLAASGTTPYVIGGVSEARAHGLLTGCIACSAGSPLGKVVEFPIEAVVGPEFITGSTRMKSGTAQKMILNMISTSVMIKLGRVKGNKMVDMQLSNHKLVARGVRMLMNELKIDQREAESELKRFGSVRAVLKNREKL
ncbi:N-acetylmuramic acid 6-phosphate etherase [Marinoscillum sp. 108]|uniref:N-acetylmuramic acid 6-phosphate etherase n=1 Tax=Marinoscillum sp. 108 TaxID=2653151 RepID=UPI0012F3B40B|nr:N-acetylmuramic acid 6-phosphate etherase [Marinoscillum sp. 108]VXD12974.1 N-acetylmuramic acid 6-phosphate etherase [Marinoscillum sp. 108]